MNAESIFKSVIEKISYQFSLGGDIVAYANMRPALQFEDGTVIDKIPINEVFEGSKKKPVIPSPGDQIELYIIDDDPNRIKTVIRQEYGIPREPIDNSICPVCGSTLIPSPQGFGRCINRACRGQISQTMILFCSGLGLSFAYVTKKIFEMLLVRGAFCTPVDLFRVVEDDLIFPGVTRLDAQAFLQYVHSARGVTSVGQLLRALRIPDLSSSDIDLIQAYFHINKLPLDAILELLEAKQKITINGESLPLDGLKVFVSIPDNAILLRDLCLILK